MRTRARFQVKASSSRKLARRASTLSILSVAAALVVTNLTPVVVTSASWTDEEWDHGAVGTLSCSDEGIFKTRGAGRLLGGEILTLDLDSVAQLKGVTAKNDGTISHADPATADETSPDTYENPFDVSALNAIELPVVEGALDRTLGSMLTLTPDPGPEGVGVVNHYARATDIGVSEGASGAVSDSGGLILTPESGSLPDLGTIKLSTLVESLTGQAIADVVAGITDLELEVGAVASRTTLDACDTAWSDDIDENLTREYAIAGLDAAVTAPAVSALSGALSNLLGQIQASLDVVAGDEGLTQEILGAVESLLGPLLGALSLGETSIVGPAITIDPAALDGLATASISDDAGLVSLDLATGRVRLNLAALLGETYSEGLDRTGLGLNDLPPNTELVINDGVTIALTAALQDALRGWTADVLSTLESAIDAVHVTATIKIVLRASVLGIGRNIADVTVNVDGTLTELLAGNGVTANAALRLTGIGVVDAVITGLLGSVLTLTDALVGVVAQPIARIIDAAIEESGLVDGLASELTDITTPVITVLGTVFNDILGADGLVSLRVNVQNDPAAGNDPDPPASEIYPDWEDGSIPDDQYDAAALSIGVLNALGPGMNVNLELARSSVGVSCAVGGVWDGGGRCDGY